MTDSLSDFIQIDQYVLDDTDFHARCRDELAKSGALVLPGFVKAEAMAQICTEAESRIDQAFYATARHNVYLKPNDPQLDLHHPRNRLIESSKGCITDNVVPADSALRVIYNAASFKSFLCAILGEKGLFAYADPLSSINVHYAGNGQQLGWHFDNSSFAVTLLLQAPEGGGVFEYVNNLRDAEQGEMNYEGVRKVLDGEVQPQTLSVDPGSLIIFRGRNAMHRVTPVEGPRNRMLVVFAYNSEPGIELSESARMTFYGRLE